MEIGRTGRDQTNSRGEASQQYDDCQQESSAIAKENLGAQRKNRCACFLKANGLHRLGPQVGNENIDKCQEADSDKAGLKYFPCHFLLCSGSVFFDKFNYQNGKNKGSNSIQCIISVKSSLGKGCNSRSVCCQRCLWHTHRRNE